MTSDLVVGADVDAATPPGVDGSRPPIVARRAMLILGVVLFGYALLDKGFAYLAIPGVPLFPGEIALGALLLVAVARPSLVMSSLRSTPMAWLVIAFMAWGAILTVAGFPRHGVGALRDASLWYYAAAAPLVTGMVLRWPSLLSISVRRYASWLPVLLAWLPVAVAVARRSDLLVIPGSDVSLLASKSGNTAVHAAMALAFLMVLSRSTSRTHTWRAPLSMLAVVVLVTAGTQGRGGLIAGCAGLSVGVALLGRRRWQVLAVAAVVGALGFGALWGSQLRVETARREISADQLIANARSIIEGGESDVGNLGSTTDWRRNLWAALIAKVDQEGGTLLGLGFGPNLGEDLVAWDNDVPRELRSPHNSHLGVYGRMGVVGLLLWVLLWGGWALTVGRFVAASTDEPTLASGVALVSIVGVVGMLVNAAVDPAFESPQVALWAWCLWGFGAAAVHVGRRVPPTGAVPGAKADG